MSRSQSGELTGAEADGGGTKPDSRLLRVRHNLLERAGGTYDTSEVSRILGITPDAVRKRVQCHRLLAFKNRLGQYRLPRAQFTRAGVLPGLEVVLAAMNVEAAWMRIQLFMDDDVIGALRSERTADAVLAAASYLPNPEHSD